MKHLLRSFLFIGIVAAFSAVVGCNTSTKKKDYDTTVARFYVESTDGDGFASVTLPVSGVQIAINNKPVITEYDFTGVQQAQSDLGKFLVFTLTPDAARDLYRISGTNQGKRLVVFINDKPLGARMIDRAFNTGAIAVFLAIPDDLLPALAKNLNGTSADLQKKLEDAKK